MNRDDLHVAPGDLGTYGNGLNRPECVLCLSDGTVITSNAEGGVSIIGPSEIRRDILGGRAGLPSVMTNGFALTKRGDFLLADLHGEGGGVWRLTLDGQLSPFLLEINGVPIQPTNFVGVDHKDRVWITVSTRRDPRSLAYRNDVADGLSSW